MGRYQHHVFICENERPAGHPRGCCHSLGAADVRSAFRDAVAAAGLPDVRCNSSSCLDACEHGPVVVVYPEGVWYRVPTAADAQDIVREHLAGGRVVQRLVIPFPPKP